MTNMQQAAQPKTLPIPPEIRAFLEDLLQEAGIVDVDSVVKEAMIQELFIRLDSYIATKVVDYLPVEKLEDFTKLVESKPSQDEVQNFLQTNVPNAQDVFTVAFGDFRNLYLENIEKAKQAQASAK